MITVFNSYGKKIDYELAVMHMDDGIRETLHDKIAPCTNQEFFDAYCKIHYEKFSEEFIADQKNPTW